MDIPTIMVNYYKNIKERVEQSLVELGEIPQEKELKEIIQKQRVLPIRFCYPESGADAWQQIATDFDYSLGNNELKTLKNTILNVKNNLPEKFDIIHIGPGQGIEIPILYKNFGENINNWVGIDISKGMLINTFDYNRRKDNNEFISKTNKFCYLTDVETKDNLSLVVDDYNKKINNNLSKLFLLIGQGVLFSNQKTLNNINDAMTNKDYLYITIEGDEPSKRKEICATYDLPFVRKLLSIGLRRADYDPEKGKFLSKFNKKTSMAEVYFKPKHEKEILCLTSYKPLSKEALEEKLMNAGFSNIKYIKNFQDIHTYTVLCQK